MAKAGNTTSTPDWIWLRDALALAVEHLGSVALAKERLIEWLAAGKLPWACKSWKGLNAEEIAKAEQQLRGGFIAFILPSAAYHEGDPKFWCVRLQIDWEDNAAREPVTGGAKALGIKVSRERLLGLLLEEPRERVEELGQTKPAERELLRPKAWLAEIRKDHPRQRNEPLVDYAHRLHDLMQEAAVTKVWSFETLQRRLHDK
jgi:hypothetical protein